MNSTSDWERERARARERATNQRFFGGGVGGGGAGGAGGEVEIKLRFSSSVIKRVLYEDVLTEGGKPPFGDQTHLSYAFCVCTLSSRCTCSLPHIYIISTSKLLTLLFLNDKPFTLYTCIYFSLSSVDFSLCLFFVWCILHLVQFKKKKIWNRVDCQRSVSLFYLHAYFWSCLFRTLCSLHKLLLTVLSLHGKFMIC